MFEILFPPRDEKTGQPKFLQEKEHTTAQKTVVPKSPEEQIRSMLWLRGTPASKIEEAVKQAMEEQKELFRLAFKRHNRPQGLNNGS